MPNCVTDFSPFSVRIRPGKKREQISDKTKNPSMTGHSSTNSINSSSRYTNMLLHSWYFYLLKTMFVIKLWQW